MTTDAFEVCREILRRAALKQEFLAEDNLDAYAQGYPEPALVPEGRFEGTAATLFVAVLVPFVVDGFEGGAKNALKEKVKDALNRLFRRKRNASGDHMATYYVAKRQ